MKTFEELKKDVIEKKNQAVAFCKEHKEGIKNAAIFAAGVIVTNIVRDELYEIKPGSHRTVTVVTDDERDLVGIKNLYYDKNDKIRKRCTDIFVFDNPKGAIEFGQGLIDAAKEKI